MKETQLSIIPRPVSVQYGEGFFQSSSLPALKGDEVFQKEINIVTEQLSRVLPSFAEGTVKSVICQKDSTLADEEYRLCSSKENITLKASTGKGIYRGLQSFRQLVLSEFPAGTDNLKRPGENGFTLPCAEISDYPRFGWRGFMLDCSRYFYSIPFIKKLIDVLSLHHINRFHWHLSDDQGWRLPVKEYPLLTEIGSRREDYRMSWKSGVGGFYQEDEIREIVDFAASRHIEVIPEIDLPGHTSAVLASYPGLGCTGGPYKVEERFGIFEDVLCAGNEEIFDLIEKVFDTLARLFPSSYVHIGGDEVLYDRWKECPKCQKKLTELGLKNPGELQSWITLRLVQMLAERDKTVIGWDEILEDSQQFKLPKETVVMSWRGYKGGIQASKHGYPVLMAPNTCGCYLDYKYKDEPEEPGQLFEGAASVYKSYSMDPVTPEMTEEEAARILGGQCNLWSELIYAGKIAEYMIFPRLCAVAEALWTPRENKDFDDFSRRLTVHQQRLDRLGLLQYRGPLR